MKNYNVCIYPKDAHIGNWKLDRTVIQKPKFTFYKLYNWKKPRYTLAYKSWICNLYINGVPINTIAKKEQWTPREKKTLRNFILTSVPVESIHRKDAHLLSKIDDLCILDVDTHLKKRPRVIKHKKKYTASYINWCCELFKVVSPHMTNAQAAISFRERLDPALISSWLKNNRLYSIPLLETNRQKSRVVPNLKCEAPDITSMYEQYNKIKERRKFDNAQMQNAFHDYADSKNITFVTFGHRNSDALCSLIYVEYSIRNKSIVLKENKKLLVLCKGVTTNIWNALTKQLLLRHNNKKTEIKITKIVPVIF